MRALDHTTLFVPLIARVEKLTNSLSFVVALVKHVADRIHNESTAIGAIVYHGAILQASLLLVGWLDWLLISGAADQREMFVGANDLEAVVGLGQVIGCDLLLDAKWVHAVQIEFGS